MVHPGFEKGHMERRRKWLRKNCGKAMGFISLRTQINVLREIIDTQKRYAIQPHQRDDLQSAEVACRDADRFADQFLDVVIDMDEGPERPF